MRSCDVVIVGAGPAGSTAARLLAARGHSVVLLEAARLGRDKPCGGGLTSRARAELPGHLAVTVRASIAVGEVRSGARNRQRFGLDEEGAVWMVRRAEFDRELAEAAIEQGVELHEREAAGEVARDGDALTVLTSRSAYRARVLLIAAGTEPRLGVAIGLAPPRVTLAPALEIEARGRARHLEPDAFVFDYTVPRGYAWAFPKGDVWNVGVLTARSHPGPSLRRHLGRVIAEWGLEFDGPEPIHATGRRIPMWRRRVALHTGRAALLGDAAGLADPFFGEGIASALLSGRLAAAAAADVLAGRHGDLAAYSHAIHRAVGAHMRRAQLAAHLVYAQPRAATRGLRLVPPLRLFARALATEGFAGV